MTELFCVNFYGTYWLFEMPFKDVVHVWNHADTEDLKQPVGHHLRSTHSGRKNDVELFRSIAIEIARFVSVCSYIKSITQNFPGIPHNQIEYSEKNVITFL